MPCVAVEYALRGVELEDMEVGEGVVRDNEGVRALDDRGFLIDTLRLSLIGEG